MQRYLAAATMVLLMGMVVSRVRLMRKLGIRAVHFGEIDKSDFLLPPFVLFYLYMVFTPALGLPAISQQMFFDSGLVAWLGVLLFAVGLLVFGWSLVSFGRSFRIGIDEQGSGSLVTGGAFGFSRNPIYVAFWLILLGQFLVFSNWILLLYLGGATWLFHRQVLREEAFLTTQFGEEFAAYCRRVRRYL